MVRSLQPQASGVGVGGTGFLIVVVLIVAVILICLALVGSLRRLRRSVARGTFGQPNQGKSDAASTSTTDGSPPSAARQYRKVSRDPGGPGAEDV